jgi:iron complex outermembrane recepter protein
MQRTHRLTVLRHAVALFCFSAACAQAQTQTIIITGNPLGTEVGATPANSLAGPGLQLRRGGSLGETLDGLPGLAATGFGPNASRPVIRGLDGDRVRVLDNSGAAVDASNLSFDHAVALDPLVAERIEVLRGPAALLYGGNATGGVVNVIDNRIPRRAQQGLAGRAELRGGGAASERAGAAVLDGGIGGLAWHVDLAGRRADDVRAPLAPEDRIPNSESRSHAAALGAGWVGDAGHLGAAVDSMRHRYGVTVEPDVIIRLERERLALAGEWRGSGFARSVSTRAGHTRYQHEEVEGTGEVGTTFKSRGDDARFELRHAPIANVQGVWGLQLESLDFSALGEEAFVPSTRTRSQALFALEEWAIPNTGLVLSGGARLEQVRVRSEGDAPDAAEPKFGAAASRRFEPKSLSVGLRATLAPGWSLQGSLGQTQRAPAYYELYANGLHLATAAFEVGDPTLGLERSRHAELGLSWQAGPNQVKLSMFNTRFANYIALDATGVEIEVPSEIPGEPSEFVPEYRFQPVRARLVGAEIEGRVRLLQGPTTLDLSGTLDTVRGDNLGADQPLPRLPPLRARLGLDAGFGPWHVGVDVRHAARQNRVGPLDTPTAGYTMLDLWARGSFAAAWSWWAKLGNATDEQGFNSAAVATVRGLSPLPGRALGVGVAARW